MNYLGQGDENWWKYLPESYQEIFNFSDKNQILMNLLFALLGIALAFMVAVRKRIFKLKKQSRSSRR
jgi:hypothetical protein